MKSVSRIGVLFAASILAFVVPPSLTFAASFTVDSTDDAVDATPGDGSCATEAGACTLRAAVQELNASQPGGSIDVPAGTYVLTIDPSGDAGDAATGSLDVTGGTITGAGRDTTIIDGGGLDDVFAFGPLEGRISALTVQNGLVGIVNHTRTLEIDDVLVLENDDAGIVGPNLLLMNSEVRDNDGPGVSTSGNFPQIIGTTIRHNAGRGIEGSAESLTITDSRISGNAAVGDGGGIAFCEYMTLTKTIVTNNSATGNGGGIASNGDCAPTVARSGRAVGPFFGKLTVIESVVNGNRALGDGGGLWVGAGLLLDRTNVDNNDAGGNGGGVWVAGGALPDLVINQSSITRNEATDGGGVYKLVGTSGRESVVNSTIAENRATGSGGGLHLTAGTFGLHNVTVAGNVADDDEDGSGDGGGLRADSDQPPVIENSILAANVDPGGEAPDCVGSLESAGYDLIGTTAGCTVTGDQTGNVVGADPHLGPLQDNGGPTLTMALLADSPALDAGDPTGCSDHEGAILATDQRLAPRPPGSGCDVGAFEDRCGNGVVDGEETCDDANSADGDCCSASCQLAPAGSDCPADGNVCTNDACDAAGVCRHDANTLPCDDGDACTRNDVCAAGTCGGGPKTSCGPCETCSPKGGCLIGPRPTCLLGIKDLTNKLEIVDKTADKNDRVAWTWAKGEATTREDLGDPLSGGNYAFCIFDESHPAPSLLFSAVSRPGQCGKKACWKPLNAKTLRYKDGERFPNGIETVVLKTGEAGKAKVTVSGKGENLTLPALPLPLPLRAQLQSETGACWETRYTAAGVSKNTAAQFKAKASIP